MVAVALSSDALLIPVPVAISFKLWRVHRETTKAGIRLKGSVILVRTISYTSEHLS